MNDRLNANERARLRNVLGHLRTCEAQREWFHLDPATLRWAAAGETVEPAALITVRRILEGVKHG